MKKTDWKGLVSKINEERYRWPEGWHTAEQVAESLQCAADQVPRILEYGIKSGRVERRQFQVWDDKRRLAISIPGYREVVGAESVAAPAQKPQSAKEKRYADCPEDAVIMCKERHPDWDERRISKATQIPIATVRRVLG